MMLVTVAFIVLITFSALTLRCRSLRMIGRDGLGESDPPLLRHFLRHRPATNCLSWVQFHPHSAENAMFFREIHSCSARSDLKIRVLASLSMEMSRRALWVKVFLTFAVVFLRPKPPLTGVSWPSGPCLKLERFVLLPFLVFQFYTYETADGLKGPKRRNT